MSSRRGPRLPVEAAQVLRRGFRGGPAAAEEVAAAAPVAVGAVVRHSI